MFNVAVGKTSTNKHSGAWGQCQGASGADDTRRDVISSSAIPPRNRLQLLHAHERIPIKCLLRFMEATGKCFECYDLVEPRSRLMKL